MIPNSIMKLGVVFKRVYFPDLLPREFMEPAFAQIFPKVKPYTMTSWERLYAAFQAVHHVVRNKVDGAVVECGVWKGGSSMMMAHALRHFGDVGRDMYLFDTFAGMTEPTKVDGPGVWKIWSAQQRGDVNLYCYSSFEEVRENMCGTGYPQERIHMVKGPVETTIPATIPSQISILRLDTDWYESTYHELTHLYPRLMKNGVLIVDDYGDWEGARRAVDQYFAEQGIRPLLNRIDPTGRVAIKCE